MKLNHINLTVTDVPAAANFLSTYFDLHNRGGNAGMTLLTDAEDYSGMILTLMKGRASDVKYPSTFHVGFSLGNRQDVDAIHSRMIADGLVVEPPGDTGHSYGFYVTAPGGFQVEVGAA